VSDPGRPGLVADVVVGLPVPRVFSYTVPPDAAGELQPGHRVRVPFQGRARIGVVVALAQRATDGLSPIQAVVDPAPALTPPLLELARWAAEQTASAWGEAVARALPPGAGAGPRARGPVGAPAGGPSIGAGGRPTDGVVVGYGPRRDQLVDAAVDRGLEARRGVLLLAPEIETARAWAAHLARRVEGSVALVTSEATPRQRWDAWWACRTGRSRVAVGTRAAAFMPVPDFGVGIVVDEHDPAHKALDAPRWHARELLVRRAAVEAGACLLTSGAPSLESWARLRSGEAVPEDAKGESWPTVHRIDLRTRPLAAGDSLVGRDLREAMRAALAAQHSVLLVLNRLGYGRALTCAECGAVPRCPRCRVALTYHLRERSLGCRLCGARHAAASQCGRCRGRRLAPLGWGSERLEAEARAALPGVEVARYDSAVDPRRATAIRAAFQARELRVVVGTQMAVRLGAEAPVGLAALVLADATLHVPDFRAGERTFQLAWHLAEAVVPGGRLWLQSFYPDHPALEAVALGAREVFYEREWDERREVGYPPARRMALVLGHGRDASRLVDEVGERCRGEGLTVLGPAPMAGARVQLIVLGGDELPGAVARALAHLRGRRRFGGVRLAVDIDPVELP
jgi:primosomal protein N' (replication factor Y)